MRSSATILVLVLVASTAGLAGCGGAGSIREALGLPPREVVTLVTEESLDGRVGSSGTVRLNGDLARALTGDRGGLFGADTDNRQVFAFDLSTLPPGARNVSAMLYVHQIDVIGFPYDKLGNVVVDQVDYVGAAGPSTYDGQSLERNLGTISTNETLESKTLDVTDAVLRSLARGDRYAQFRLRFHRPGMVIYDFVTDYARFGDGECEPDPGEIPAILMIGYEP